MFKSGNVLSSDGRGIVREVRVAVFAVISRHIRRRDSLLFSLSLSLVLLLLLLRDALLLILMRVVFGWNICCEGIKRLLGSFFLFLIFAIFFALFGNRPPSSSSSSEFFQRKHFPHLHSTTHRSIIFAVIGWTRERGEDFREHATEKKKTRVCVSSVVRSKERERERERETVLPHTTRR